MKMYVRRVKRKCNVRGCGNTDSFAISRTREAGNSVIICKDCLTAALAATDEIEPDAKSNIPAMESATIPPLFFNAQAQGTEPAAEGENTEPSASDEDEKLTETAAETANHFVCSHCGRAFDSEKGLKAHARHCEQQ